MNSEVENYKSSDVRSKIYNSGISLMLSQGYEITTIRQICKKAGVSIGSFYTYFSTKSALLADMYEASDTYFVSMLSIDFSKHTAVSLYEEFIERYIKLDLETGLNKMKLLSNVDNKQSLKKRTSHNLLLKIIKYGQESGEFRSDYAVTDIIDYIFDVLHGIANRYCISEGAIDLAQKMRFSSALTLDSIKKQ